MYPFTNDVMSVEISGNALKAMMSHAADPKNGMQHVSKTAKFKHYNTKPLVQRIVKFDIKGKQVADSTFSEAAHEKRESVSNKIRKLKLSRFN
ncbi:hypothetical protein DSB59_05510 [Salmonella enterica subsp. enterica serovar Montevideo]|nr:hypothetical protein [Salmonella enterica subsp. enterica serovar Montevideo]